MREELPAVLSRTPVHHILVLDDDEVMRELLDLLLSQEGYRITLASSGEDALRLLHDGLSPQLVLTDVHMPGLAGEALALALRSALPVGTLLIGMSGTQLPPRLRAIYDAFLVKPFGPEALEEAIRSAWNQPAEARPAASDPEEDLPSTRSLSENDPGPAVLDETVFAALAKSIPAPQLGQLYAMTLADIGKRHARMEAAAAAGDLSNLRREAHTVKGSCGFVGASELQALAAALETGTTPSTSALAEIPAACLRLRSMLKSRLYSA